MAYVELQGPLYSTTTSFFPSVAPHIYNIASNGFVVKSPDNLGLNFLIMESFFTYMDLAADIGSG